MTRPLAQFRRTISFPACRFKLCRHSSVGQSAQTLVENLLPGGTLGPCEMLRSPVTFRLSIADLDDRVKLTLIANPNGLANQRSP